MRDEFLEWDELTDKVLNLRGEGGTTRFDGGTGSMTVLCGLTPNSNPNPLF